MHSITQEQSFFYAAFTQALLDLGSDINKGTPGRHIKPQLFMVTFHNSSSFY
jgi:hypothetical protein